MLYSVRHTMQVSNGWLYQTSRRVEPKTLPESYKQPATQSSQQNSEAADSRSASIEFRMQNIKAPKLFLPIRNLTVQHTKQPDKSNTVILQSHSYLTFNIYVHILPQSPFLPCLFTLRPDLYIEMIV